eukprot:CAMPEP_0116141534 /NCGR_PEP_ID=MMETSP0329-20121206/14432_1 /TAXON_ID=697910 /ORGANISM="Pseudo-nitzschia arenysensis, Strain B593" /LENGTH=619 /DNA_ID=CAMNT_0003636721 /DNA_START=205 /DNA_END=2064 /DNA_ORIENTATION=-
MLVDNGKSTVALHSEGKAEKPSFTISTAGSLTETMNKKLSGDTKKADPMANISSMMVPSTDTTLSTVTTKIDEETNEMEILLLQLDSSDDVGGFKDEDNDESSVVSSTSSIVSRYFEPTDFISWEEMYSKAEYVPHVGFAIAAGGFAFFHPIAFFAGVVTAVGAARAAGATYEYAMCMQQGKSNGHEGEDIMLPCDCFNALGFNDTLRSANLEAEKALSAAESKLADGNAVPLAKSNSTCSTTASTVEELQDESIKSKVAIAPSASIPSVIESPRKAKSPKSFDASQWAKEHFPVLPIVALENVEFRGLNANEFFDVFFADDAPFGFPAFHILRRDKEVQYSCWNTGCASNDPDRNIELPSFIATKEREVQYHAKTNSFLGPAFAPTKKLQRAYFVSKKMLVIEIRMTLHDIPFSKQFYLIERWVIDGTRTGSDSISRTNSRKEKRKQNNVNSPISLSSHCVYLTVSSEVYFTEECAFESAVKKESTKQVCEISKCWNAMAQAGLKRTEETRTRRLRQIELEKERANKNSSTDDNEGIEIEHIENDTPNVFANGRRRSRRLSGIRKFRRSSSQFQSQQSSGRPQNRRLSQSFSKLLNRRSSSMKPGDGSQELLQVRISS